MRSPTSPPLHPSQRTLTRKTPSASRPSPTSSARCCPFRGCRFVRFLTREGVFGRGLRVRFLRGIAADFDGRAAAPLAPGGLEFGTSSARIRRTRRAEAGLPSPGGGAPSGRRRARGGGREGGAQHPEVRRRLVREQLRIPVVAQRAVQHHHL